MERTRTDDLDMTQAIPHQRELETALEAVRLATQLCKAVQGGIAASSTLVKEDRSPVTVADFGSQALICDALHRAFPDDPIMAEEDAASLASPANAAILGAVTAQVQRLRPEASSSDIRLWIDRGRTRVFCDRFWTLDPIDGTKGFLRGEQYAISLALIIDGEVELVVLGCPNLEPPVGVQVPVHAPSAQESGAIFYAVRGHGAWSVPVSAADSAAPARLHVSAIRDSSRARFVESVESGHSSHSDAARVADRLAMTRPPLRMDSQAKYATVGRGDAELYLRLPTRADYREKIWDHAGGLLIVTEAGGKVTDISGKPLDFRHGPELTENRGVVASNGLLHAELVAALAALKIA